MKNKNLNSNTLFDSWSFTSLNYSLFGIGIFVILIGYIIMATGETESIQSVKIAPLVLTIGYCVIIPAAILIKDKKKK